MNYRIIIIVFLVLAGVIVPAKLAYDAINGTSAGVEAQTASAQDQTGSQDAATDSQEEGTKDPSNAASDRKFINNLAPNEYTPDAYIPPSYDPFNNPYRSQEDYTEQYPPLIQPNTKPFAEFAVEVKNRKGLAESNAGTVGTEFRFNANQITDDETKTTGLQVRWDFESDGKPDSYFSNVKSIRHTFTKAGTYDVTLEVLDKGGATAKAIKQVKIVENTPPFAYQIAKTKRGTPATIFEFDTAKSSDSQYMKQYLAYRFDWNNDGIWDTAYKTKTLWRHRFEKSGSYRVVMEAKDPEGLTATWYQDIEVIGNTPPEARFVISRNGKSYTFDASSSTDAESPKQLLYRWDFNYTGADDIAFDSYFSTAKKRTGVYGIPGHKTIRLQVKDADGVISEAFATLDVK